jgi:hypothetical protein
MKRFSTLLVCIVLSCNLSFAQAQRWSAVKANTWYSHQPWLVGSNYIPASDSNELEMWQAETFNAEEIDKELGWAQSLGMNTMRVFLHDLIWQQDAEGFYQRIDTFLTIADKHHIRPIFVLFDSCWDPMPKLGPQHAPTPGVHNSGWVQSPGANALRDPKQYPRLRGYVRGVVGRFANDHRVLAWDIWNEPSNTNHDAYGKQEPRNKQRLVLVLLPRAFTWARSANPTQPLTSGVWEGNWSSTARMNPIQQVQIHESDVISFHNYSKPVDFEKRVRWLQRYHRPIICTEYMARSEGSRFDTILPLAKRLHVAAINWGLVLGKTQTNLPWNSWAKPYVDSQPPEWFHDVFYPDGKPYKDSETKMIRELTGAELTQPQEPK